MGSQQRFPRRDLCPAGQVLCALHGSAPWTETEHGFKRIKKGKRAELTQEKYQYLYRAPEAGTKALPAEEEGGWSTVPVCGMGPPHGWNNTSASRQLLGKRQR